MILPRTEAATRATEASKRAKWQRVTFRDNRAPETLTEPLGSRDHCWCGRPVGHRWPGEESGVPHPRQPGEPPCPTT